VAAGARHPVPTAPFDPAAYVASLPHLPGVYRMLSAAGDVLYVGKALDLRKRVAAYFQKTAALSPRIRLMLSQVAAVETTVTRSEAEALLLENNLIKSLTPRYNILFRDDKSYPYLMLTGHRYPRLGFHRGGLGKPHRYFGPFPNAGAVRESMHLLQKVFRLRTCEDTVFANRSRPCLLHQIRRCSAPCVGRVEEAAYAEDVRGAELFLSGKEDEVIERLVGRMEAASRRQDYEAAAVYRDQVAALRKVREKQFISGESGADVDVVACARAAGTVCINLVMIRGGHHLGDKNVFPRNAEDAEDVPVLEAFIAQHYLSQAPPPEIVVGGAVAAAALEALLAAATGRAVRIGIHPAGARRVWLEMARKNAQLGAAQALGLQANQESRLAALQRALQLPETAQRIECFDISHTMGEATVGACVVYDRGAMQKSEYRRYNVAGVEPGDDYGAMREVLSRRYRRIVTGEGRMPDLVLIDGGKGQLGVACEVFSELGLSEVALAAVAKGEERKPGLEQLLVPGRERPLVLPPSHPGLHLVQQIRDEAHRFAIAGHRARRGKARARSSLEAISGVGVKRRQRLLARFGGMRGLLAASVDELAQVEGISRELAARIHQELH
jgi:excinuclease ABC subunit C